MIQKEKVKLMTRLAISEKNMTKNDKKANKFYKTDYIKSQRLKTILCVTIGYILILCSIFLINLESIVNNIFSLNYKDIIFEVLLGYVFIWLFYTILIGKIYSKRYDKSKQKMLDYYDNLKKLRTFYRENTQYKKIRKIDESEVINKDDDTINY